MSKQAKSIYTIPPGYNFAALLAGGILERYGHAPEQLTNIHILLPSRRTCRTVREAFLSHSNGVPLLIPRLQPLGDIDSDELSLFFEPASDIPPAMTGLQRHILLSKLIGAAYDSYPLPQRLMLAKALGRLMDQTYTEDLDLRDLPGLVDREKFAAHWQITVDFLKILSEEWPKLLSSHGLIDAADRRNRLIKAQAENWRENPPDFPVIAAGTTGSIPAVAGLLDIISGLPQGEIILPGLDQDMDDQSWDGLDETHPQAMLRQLLNKLNVQRQGVRLWPNCTEIVPVSGSERAGLISEIMRPAESVSAWTVLGQDEHSKGAYKTALKDVCLYECANAGQEAQVIATALRETLEKEGQTAALITPDRNLARRVAAKCKRWGIEIDDSGGQSLIRSRRGSFLMLCLQAALSGLKPASLLGVLKHEMCLPGKFESRNEWLEEVHKLDLALRGPAPHPGLNALQEYCKRRAQGDYPLPSPSQQFFEVLEEVFAPLLALTEADTPASFEDFLQAHLQACELLSPPARLWSGEDGEEASLFFQSLQEQASALGRVSPDAYEESLHLFMQGISVRPRYGTHPRLMILGQLEARLLQTDRVILSGLNDGTWPETPQPDPWMSRPMRKAFGLPPAERSTGLAAHDFVQGFMGRNVILTRSLREGSTLTVPSRWLQRLDAVLQAAGLPEDLIRKNGPHLDWVRQADRSKDVKPAPQPKVDVPVKARPTPLSVTSIDTWLRDPYALYARKILGLKKLDPPEQKADYALKGSLLHEILHELMLSHQKQPMEEEQLSRAFMKLAEERLKQQGADPALLYFWRPRLRGIASWFAAHQVKWESDWRLNAFETQGQCEIDGPVRFTLKARADRIDAEKDGTGAAIIDYKSAGSYKAKEMVTGAAPQLPLEGYILKQGGFEKAGKTPALLSYLVLSGGEEPGKTINIDGQQLEQAIENAHTGLQNLLQHFYGEAPAPYIALPDPARAPRYNDYLHLARAAEWSSPGDPGQETA